MNLRWWNIPIPKYHMIFDYVIFSYNKSQITTFTKAVRCQIWKEAKYRKKCVYSLNSTINDQCCILKQAKPSTFLGNIFSWVGGWQKGENVFKYYLLYLCFLTEEMALQICLSIYGLKFYPISFDDIIRKSKFR